MTLYFKIGTMPGEYLVPVDRWSGRALRKEPTVGQFFSVKKPGEKYAKPESVHCLEIRDLGVGTRLFVCERF